MANIKMSAFVRLMLNEINDDSQLITLSGIPEVGKPLGKNTRIKMSDFVEYIVEKVREFGTDGILIVDELPQMPTPDDDGFYVVRENDGSISLHLISGGIVRSLSGFEIFQNYNDIPEMLLDAGNQNENKILRVKNASDDPNLSFANTETKRQAFYRYNGVATGSLDDYTLISAPYREVDGGQVLEESTSVKIVGDKIQRAALAGDVTAAQNSNELTISEGAVSNAKMENMAANTIKGRIASTDAPQDLNAEQVRTILNVENGAQKNVKTDWNATEGDAELLNKPNRVNFNIYNQTKNNAVTISSTVKTVINPLTTGSSLLPSTGKDSSYIGRIFGKFTSGGSSENITLEFKIANTTREVVFSNSDSSAVVFYVDYAINYLDARTPTLSGIATVGDQSFLIDLDFGTTVNASYEISATLTGGTLVVDSSYLHRNHN